MLRKCYTKVALKICSQNPKEIGSQTDNIVLCTIMVRAGNKYAKSSCAPPNQCKAMLCTTTKVNLDLHVHCQPQKYYIVPRPWCTMQPCTIEVVHNLCPTSPSMHTLKNNQCYHLISKVIVQAVQNCPTQFSFVFHVYWTSSIHTRIILIVP